MVSTAQIWKRTKISRLSKSLRHRNMCLRSMKGVWDSWRIINDDLPFPRDCRSKPEGLFKKKPVLTEQAWKRSFLNSRLREVNRKSETRPELDATSLTLRIRPLRRSRKLEAKLLLLICLRHKFWIVDTAVKATILCCRDHWYCTLILSMVRSIVSSGPSSAMLLVLWRKTLRLAFGLHFLFGSALHCCGF